GATGWSDARQHLGDHVVDVAGQKLWRDHPGNVRVENLEEITESFSFGFFAEVVESLEGREIAIQIIVEGHAVQAEVCSQRALVGFAFDMAALDVIDAGGPKRA